MSSKKYRDKPCVYCSSRPAVTADHVFAREFFLPSIRANLPKVPSCKQCNNEKSTLEHYLTALLPFGGRHSDAHENLATMVPRRLAKNAALWRSLAENQGYVIRLEDGIYQRVMSLAFQSEDLKRLFVLITRGLAWYHWKVLLTEEHRVCALLPSDHGRQLFDRFFRTKALQRVAIDLGKGAVRYEGVQTGSDAQIIAWRFQVYGGLVLAGDPNVPGATTSEIWTFSGPLHILRESVS